MKKFFIICVVAASGFAINSFASGNHNTIRNYSSYSDTTPMGKSKKKMKHDRMNSDSGMSMQSDSSTTTAPPQK